MGNNIEINKKRNWLGVLSKEIDRRTVELVTESEALKELRNDLIVARKDFILSECINEKEWKLAIDGDNGACLQGGYVVDRPLLHEFLNWNSSEISVSNLI